MVDQAYHEAQLVMAAELANLPSELKQLYIPEGEALDLAFYECITKYVAVLP